MIDSVENADAGGESGSTVLRGDAAVVRERRAAGRAHSRVREAVQAELAKLQVTQQRGELVPVDEVKKEAFNIGRAVRESLSNLADRLSHQLAGEVDPVVIHKLLTDEHRAALLELTEG